MNDTPDKANPTPASPAEQAAEAPSPAANVPPPSTAAAPVPAAPAAPVPPPTPAGELPAVRDSKGRSYATGKRKESCARVWLSRGSGHITVNGRKVEQYFARSTLRQTILAPLVATERQEKFDVVGTIIGGGLSGQAGALRHGISRALVAFEPALRPLLRAQGFLTRDSRIVERKKYGRHKARRSHQFSKR